MKKNALGQKIGAQMIALDGSAFIGLATVYVTGDAGIQTAGTGVCAHKGNGYHAYEPSQAETNYDHIAFTFVGDGAVSTAQQVYPMDPPAVSSTIAPEIASIKAQTESLDAQMTALAESVAAIKAKTDSLSDTAPLAGMTLQGFLPLYAPTPAS